MNTYKNHKKGSPSMEWLSVPHAGRLKKTL